MAHFKGQNDIYEQWLHEIRVYKSLIIYQLDEQLSCQFILQPLNDTTCIPSSMEMCAYLSSNEPFPSLHFRHEIHSLVDS